MWNLSAPPAFQGLREDLPLRCYSRHMPHWRQEGATYFVTFRLADSLPQEKLRELKRLRATAKAGGSAQLAALAEIRRGVGRTSSPSYEVMRRVEEWLDCGMGSCALRDPATASIVVDAMRHFDGQRYELGCFVVMPNHVHAVVRPFDGESMPLERILQSWKGWTARRIHAKAKSEGGFWQDETFDRIVRDEEHLWRAVQYVGSNPRRANLDVEACPRWVRPDWIRLGWGFNDANANEDGNVQVGRT